MKNIKNLGILLITIAGLYSCDTNNDFVFTAQEPQSLSFSNSFLEEYVLIPAATNNLGERFTWKDADYGAPALVKYELEWSIIGDFSDAVKFPKEPNGNEIAVTIGELLSIADAIGLDNDPNSPEKPDRGNVFFRLKATIGIDALPVYSVAQTLTLFLPEESTGGGGGLEKSTWGVKGSGYAGWGGSYPDAVFYTTGTPGVLVTYVTLIDGEIKFRENNAWDSNFGDNGNDGTLDAGGANIPVTAGTYKITFNTNDATYTKEVFSWGLVGSATLNGWNGPDARFYYDYTTDTFKVGVQLIDGEIKFRMNNAWDVNFGDTGADGTLEAGGDNIVVTAGYYNITLDLNNNAYTLEAGNVWGLVGSATPNGWNGPDFRFTQVNEGIWIAELVPLVDGEMKFRVNDAWDINFGDTGADGTLDAGGDNITVTAGTNTRILLDLVNGSYKMAQ